MNTLPDDKTMEQLIGSIESAPPRPHHHALLAATEKVLCDYTFRSVLSIGGWYRAGGVLTAEGNHLSNALESWVNTELAICGEDYELFLEHYTDVGLLTTRYMGRTHYFVAPYGPAPEDFLQLEVEELQEILDRKLIDPEQPPQDRTELVEPIAHVKLDAHPIGSPHYRFARLVDVRQVLARQNALTGGVSPLARFMSEWSQSRAAERGHFCEHWLIAGLERYTPAATTAFTAQPLSVHARTLKPFPWDLSKTGIELSSQTRDFDRAAGYPAGWYFHLVASNLVPDKLALDLKRDHDNGYQYLADKDLSLLDKLIAAPYHMIS